MFELGKKVPLIQTLLIGLAPHFGFRIDPSVGSVPHKRPLFDPVAPPASYVGFDPLSIKSAIAILQVQGQRLRAMGKGRPRTESHSDHQSAGCPHSQSIVEYPSKTYFLIQSLLATWQRNCMILSVRYATLDRVATGSSRPWRIWEPN
jgi:hypothetical protein